MTPEMNKDIKQAFKSFYGKKGRVKKAIADIDHADTTFKSIMKIREELEESFKEIMSKNKDQK